MILRLIAVALLDLPQTVILPGQHMVRIRLQRALVPDLRELVVAELAIGIADQIGDIRVIVVAERLELIDPSVIIVAVVDRRIGCAVTAGKAGIVNAGLLAALLLVRGAGARDGPGARRRRVTGGRRTTTTAAASGGNGRNERRRRDQRHRKNYQRH